MILKVECMGQRFISVQDFNRARNTSIRGSWIIFNFQAKNWEKVVKTGGYDKYLIQGQALFWMERGSWRTFNYANTGSHTILHDTMNGAKINISTKNFLLISPVLIPISTSPLFHCSLSSCSFSDRSFPY